MAEPAVDAEALVERLWEEVGAREASDQAFESLEMQLRERMQHLSELRHLNHHWDFAPPSAGAAAGARWRGRARNRLARFVLHVLDPYFVNQREFNEHVVRVANAYAGAIDSLADDVRALAEALSREAQRLSDRDRLLHDLLEARVSRLEGEAGDAPRP